MTQEENFLGEFPILRSGGYDLYRTLSVSDKSRRYSVDVILNCIEGEQLDISSAISHEGIDMHLLPRLRLVRDIYNKLTATLNQNNPNGTIFAKKVLDLAFTKKVLPPKFYLSLDQQGLLREIKSEIKAEEFIELYRNLVNRICEKYEIREARTTEDWLHEERIILPVCEGYTFELTKPTGFCQTFEIHANNLVYYELLPKLSHELMEIARASLSEKIKIYDYKFANCNFLVSLDISVPKMLNKSSLERLLITG